MCICVCVCAHTHARVCGESPQRRQCDTNDRAPETEPQLQMELSKEDIGRFVLFLFSQLFCEFESIFKWKKF